MGYYTNYELDFDAESNLTNEILDFIEDNEEYYGLGEDSYKWYDHEAAMIELSKKYPTVLFKLHGEGEEQGDIWDKYFKNGKMKVSRARIVLDEIDESDF